MTAEERFAAVAEFGFTPRQARFLTLVMRHAGVCLPRQYSTFADIVHGQKTRAFFHKLVSAGFASVSRCRHNRGRIYHVQHYPLYRAIGAPNSPHRRPVPAESVVERLMVLDAVLADPELHWLATAAEKVAYFTTSACPVPMEKLPRVTNSGATPPIGHPFPDRLPIGVDGRGRAIFTYLVLPAGGDDLRSFISRHTDLLQALPLWTLRLVFPPSIADAYAGFQAVVRQELESPLHPRTVEELTWYFGQLRAMPSARVRLTDERFERAAAAFYGPRFSRLYRQWLRNGDGVLGRITSTALSDALASDAGRVECLILPHRYDHLSPVVDIGELTCRRARKVERESAESTRTDSSMLSGSVSPIDGPASG